MRPEVIAQDERMGGLTIRRADGYAYCFYAISIDVMDDDEPDPRGRACASLALTYPREPDVYWEVPREGERFLQLKLSTGYQRVITDRDPEPGELAGWTFWCIPRLREYRPDAPGLRTRPRRIT